MTKDTKAHSSFRHSARAVALQALYALDLQQHRSAARASSDAGEAEQPAPRSAEEVFEGVSQNFEMPAAAHDFAHELVLQVSERRDELDATIGKHTRNWRLSRMAIVDRNILRLASYELGHTDTPIRVILDEAVEMARRFGSDASPAFVNGVLDAVARQLRGGEGASA